MITLPPFKAFLASNIPSVYDNTLSYYDELTKLIAYLEQQVVPAVNETAGEVDGIKTGLEELKSYVDHYFDNLDVQEEIDNKLDEMTEDGTLEEIIGHYITTNYVEKDYYATDDTAGLVKPGAGLSVAADGTLSETPFDQFIAGDTKTYEYTSGNTHTFINYAIISSEYKPFIVMADTSDPDVRKTASEIDAQYKPSYMINAGGWNTADNYTYGPVIIDGNVEVTNNLGGGTATQRTILAISNTGEITSINGATAAADIDAPYCVRTWATIFNNGVTYYGDTNSRDPRTFLAQDFDGNYLIGTCGGRVANDTGMTYEDIDTFIRTTLSFNAKVIFNLDGGGSSQYLYRGIRQNKLVNNENRAVPNFIVWSSPSAKADGLFEAQSEAAKKLIDNEKISSNDVYEDSWFGDHLATEHATMRVNGSSMRIIEGRTVVMNVRIDVDSVGLAAYDAVFENLPTQTNTNTFFFKGMNFTTFDDAVFYLEVDAQTGKTTIHNRTALTEGSYGFSLTYTCEPQN